MAPTFEEEEREGVRKDWRQDQPPPLPPPPLLIILPIAAGIQLLRGQIG